MNTGRLKNRCMTGAPLDKPGYHILLAHGGDEKHIPVQRKALMAAGFDYVALGHIHKPEIISDKMAYAGALEPIDRLDMGARGYIYGEITNRGTRIQFCPASCREYREMVLESDTDMTSGEMEQWLQQQIHIEGDKHIYNVVLKGYRDTDIVYQRTVWPGWAMWFPFGMRRCPGLILSACITKIRKIL